MNSTMQEIINFFMFEEPPPVPDTLAAQAHRINRIREFRRWLTEECNGSELQSAAVDAQMLARFLGEPLNKRMAPYAAAYARMGTYAPPGEDE